MKLRLHSPIRPRGMMLNKLGPGTTLPLRYFRGYILFPMLTAVAQHEPVSKNKNGQEGQERQESAWAAWVQ